MNNFGHAENASLKNANRRAYTWSSSLPEQKIGQVSNYPIGTMKLEEVAGKQILIVNVDGKIYAIENACTHRGAPLNEGTLEGKVVTCPWHGGKFEVTTGKVLNPPPKTSEPTYQVKIQGNDVIIVTP